MINILFTCAGRRNYLINYFKEVLGRNGKTIAMDMQANAPALFDADISIKSPSIYDDEYLYFLDKNIKKYDVDALISLNDLELPLLSKNKDRLSENNDVKIIVSDQKIIDISFDKWKTFNFLKSIGLKSPCTFKDLKSVKDAIKKNKIQFPLVVKPRWGSASINIDFVEDEKELDLAYNLQLKRLKRTTLPYINQDNIENAIIIQEKINGIEYGIDILNDFSGKYYGTFARKKLSMRSGETDKAISVINEKIADIGKKISLKLKHIGILDCDIFFDDKDYHILELNPRFGGGYPFSHEAGINTCAIYVEWIKGNKNVDKFNNYKEDVLFVKYDSLLNVSKGS